MTWHRHRRLTFFHLVARPIYLWYLAGVMVVAWGQQNLAFLLEQRLLPAYHTNGEVAVDAFAPVAEPVRHRTLSLLAPSGETIALATPLPLSGHAVTKLSEVDGIPGVRAVLPLGQSLEAAVIGRDADQDLALLRLSTEEVPGLHALRWKRKGRCRLGDMVCAPGQEDRLWMGVVSAPQREIQGGAALGVRIGRHPLGLSRGAFILEVFPMSPARRGGIRPGDHVIRAEGLRIGEPWHLSEIIRRIRPGESVALRIVREDRQLDLEIPLGYDSIFRQHIHNPEINGETSERQNGFPEAIQHDIPLAARFMGGPLVDLEGRIVGINIARVDRVTTLAIPSGRVLEWAEGVLR